MVVDEVPIRSASTIGPRSLVWLGFSTYDSKCSSKVEITTLTSLLVHRNLPPAQSPIFRHKPKQVSPNGAYGFLQWTVIA